MGKRQLLNLEHWTFELGDSEKAPGMSKVSISLTNITTVWGEKGLFQLPDVMDGEGTVGAGPEAEVTGCLLPKALLVHFLIPS